jgi:mRNA-degrading endonuclease toxin of MazEF toxin-antitoxin module
LSKTSVINVSQLLTLDKRLLSGRVKQLPPSVMHEVDGGLRLALNLAGADA